MSSKFFVLALMVMPAIVFADSNEDAVRRFGVVASHAEKAINESRPEFSPPQGTAYREWYRRKIYTSPVSFDVRRTDSLVSPLVGEVLLQCNVRGASAPSEEEIRAKPDSFDQKTQCKASYAFQSSRWVFKALSCENFLNRGGPWKVIDSSSDDGTSSKCLALLPRE